MTVPVNTKGKRNQIIKDVEILNDNEYSKNHRKSIEYNYHKAPHYQKYSKDISDILEIKPRKLIDLNMILIQHLSKKLKIECDFKFASDLDVEGKKDELLASICNTLKADEYISPPGSSEYLERSDKFTNIDIPVRYFKYTHPEYQQLNGEFLSHMSIIDMLFCCGSAESSQLIHENSFIA